MDSQVRSSMMWREFGEKTPGPLDLVVSDIDLSQALLESSSLHRIPLPTAAPLYFHLSDVSDMRNSFPAALSTRNNPSISTHMATAKACVRCHSKKIRVGKENRKPGEGGRILMTLQLT